jgi:peroxiredoxin
VGDEQGRVPSRYNQRFRENEAGPAESRQGEEIVSVERAGFIRGSACALLAVVVLAGVLSGSCGRKEPPPKNGDDEAAPARSTAGQDRLPATEFALKDIEGRTVRLADFQGKVVMVNFWATWCPPCRMEIPDFVSLQRDLGSKGLQIIGVSLDDEGAAKVRPFAEQNGINYTMLVNGQDVASRYGGIQGIPTTFLLDRQGRIVERREGVVSPAHWRQAIDDLLQED